MALIGRLLALLSVLLMPLGMEAAAASAPAIGHYAMVGTAMEHCPDQSSKHEHNDGLAMCSMACASALPAQDLVRDDTILRSHQLVLPITEQTLHGLHPDTATPPPKRS
jgi:hypothetical protein